MTVLWLPEERSLGEVEEGIGGQMVMEEDLTQVGKHNTIYRLILLTNAARISLMKK